MTWAILKGLELFLAHSKQQWIISFLILSAFTGRIPPPKDPDGVATVSWDCAMPTLLGEGAGQAVTQPSVWDDL